MTNTSTADDDRPLRRRRTRRLSDQQGLPDQRGHPGHSGDAGRRASIHLFRADFRSIPQRYANSPGLRRGRVIL